MTKRAILLAVSVVIAVQALPTAHAGANTSCPRPANQPTKGSDKPIEPKVTLKPEASSETINFGGSRGTKSVDVVLLASHPLPKTFSPKQLELDSPKRFRRAGQMLDSSSLRLPRFSNPQIVEHRKKIRLRICIDATDAQAGTYSGTVYISGPPGVSSTSIAITANIKTSECNFMLVVILGLILSFLLLLFKAAKDQKKGSDSWPKAIRGRFTDAAFIASTAVALGAALVAMRAIYDSNPAWGAETWTNVFAILGTAFGAAGVGGLIASFTQKSP